MRSVSVPEASHESSCVVRTLQWKTREAFRGLVNAGQFVKQKWSTNTSETLPQTRRRRSDAPPSNPSGSSPASRRPPSVRRALRSPEVWIQPGSLVSEPSGASAHLRRLRTCWTWTSLEAGRAVLVKRFPPADPEQQTTAAEMLRRLRPWQPPSVCFMSLHIRSPETSPSKAQRRFNPFILSLRCRQTHLPAASCLLSGSDMASTV